MTCLWHLSSYAAVIFTRTSPFLRQRSLYRACSCSWNAKLGHPSDKSINLFSVLTTFRVQCYSSKKALKSASRSKKFLPEPQMEQEKEKDAFFVVRKGDVVGIYKSLTDCQAQVGSSICDPPVSVYKGYFLAKETEEYLLSRGLKNAMYTIRAADLKEDIFGMLVPCPFQDPAFSKGEASSKGDLKRRFEEELGAETAEGNYLTSIVEDPMRKHVKLDPSAMKSCILEFDGASKGNPGQAGAGAVLRSDDGSLICRLREGLGVATNNVAEYRGLILGMRYALQKGYTSIRVKGDSKLVCLQVQGLWKSKNENLSVLLNQALALKDKFLSFNISHLPRSFNAEADAQANLGVPLADGQVQEE